MWYLAVGRKIEIGQRAVSTILVSCAAFFLSAHFLGVTRFLGSFHGFFSPLFAVVIIMLTLDRSSASRVLSQRWLVVLGESSYALYIIHIPLLWLFESALKGMGIDRSYLLGFGVYLPLVIFLSILTFRRVEWPAQDWLRKNPGTVLVFLLDTLLVSAAIYLAYLARVGLDVRHFDREIAFSIRMGLPIVLLSLAVFGFYKTPASILEWRWVARRLFVPLAAAAGVLGLALWLARNDGLIDSFPRTLPLIAFAALFGVLYASRVILRRWRTQLSSFA